MSDRRRTWTKRAAWMTEVIVLLIFMAVPVFAATFGSLTIRFHGRTQTNEEISLSGAEFSLYPVGRFLEGNWELLESFQASGISLKAEDASERTKQAKELYAYARKQKIEGMSGQTDSNGIVHFENQEQGLYLVAQVGAVKRENRSYVSAPFLISIPTKEAEEIFWDVVTEPKSEWTKDDSDHDGGGTDEEHNRPKPSKPQENWETDKIEPTVEPKTSEERNEMIPVNAPGQKEISTSSPETGDTTLLGMWAVIGLVSLCMIGILYLRIKTADDAEKCDDRDTQ